MEKQAIAKYLHVSPYKAREVTRLIQRKPVDEALSALDFMPKKAANLVARVLRSAVANMENSANFTATRDELVVKEAVVGEGPTMKRFRTKARGMAGRIRKRTSHIRVVVETT